jgi:hypothetical protein
MSKPWFEVDRDGLRKLVADRAGSFVLWGLLQNAWDEPGVTTVSLEATREDGSPYVEIMVCDDAPEGFHDMTNAWTLFADVRKRRDPKTRGRFCLGDKLVLALARKAQIVTTKGGVLFDEKGRHILRQKTSRGSEVRVEVRMSKEEMDLALERVITLAVPPVSTLVNGTLIPERLSTRFFSATLMTVSSDAEGIMRQSMRATDVQMLDAGNRGGWLMEMGIPVLHTEDKYDVNVMQKIPLNQNRDNVSAHYLTNVRVAVLNVMFDDLVAEDANKLWVRDACSSPRVSKEALKKVMTLRFGDKPVSYDPSDREANLKAASRGMTVVTGASLSAGEWQNVRDNGLIVPAGRVCPTPKMYDGEGEQAEVIDEKDWKPSEKALARLTANIAEYSGLMIPTIRFVRAGMGKPGACAIDKAKEIHYNVNTLGRNWAIKYRLLQVLMIVIHELAHNKGENHFDEAYREELERIGANAVSLALNHPEMFDLPE